ncbi:amidase [Azorhizobium doebereinerae]|uniref:amidase n=1 Tax=Azorhizobium doebereinerae TaxID=281091 RepID=UPI0003FBE114|nr:amidase [Azorhizobium doebereinerae]
MTLHDPLNAFVAHGAVDIQRRTDGPLAGRTFALKDFFDLAGVPTGAGSPHWLASHPVPTASTPCVDLLLDAGAHLVGKTHTDELAWSLNGENAHYGTPTNPAAPGRIPGGSSSGSAAAVAGKLVDFAIGSDTGGSVRLPASYCGIIGIRTTHGRVSLAGAVPLAPSYDTLGWFARDAELFAQVGAVLLGPAPTAPLPNRLMVADDLFAAAGPAVGAALKDGLSRVMALYAPAASVTVAPGGLGPWRNAFRLIQSAEAWAAHGPWVEQVKPAFGPGVRERFAAAARLDPEEVKGALALRADIRARMDDILGDDGLLLLPTGPGIAPLLATPEPELDAFRARALELLCPAGHAGLPQISLPLGTLDGCPVGLSIIAPRGRDEALLDLARKVMAA